MKGKRLSESFFYAEKTQGGGVDVTMPNWNEIRTEWETTKITFKAKASIKGK